MAYGKAVSYTHLSLSDLQEVKARHQGDVFRERMYEKNRQMSFRYLKEILGMKEGDVLSVSLSVSEDTLLLMPQVEVEEVYLRSVHAVSYTHLMPENNNYY